MEYVVMKVLWSAFSITDWRCLVIVIHYWWLCFTAPHIVNSISRLRSWTITSLVCTLLTPCRQSGLAVSRRTDTQIKFKIITKWATTTVSIPTSVHGSPEWECSLTPSCHRQWIIKHRCRHAHFLSQYSCLRLCAVRPIQCPVLQIRPTVPNRFTDMRALVNTGWCLDRRQGTHASWIESVSVVWQWLWLMRTQDGITVITEAMKHNTTD